MVINDLVLLVNPMQSYNGYYSFFEKNDKYSRDMFFEMLRKNGIKKVTCYRDDATMQKEYGYFVV